MVMTQHTPSYSTHGYDTTHSVLKTHVSYLLLIVWIVHIDY